MNQSKSIKLVHQVKQETEMKFDTLLMHALRDAGNVTGAVSVPIYQSATFAHPGVGQSTGYDYSRSQNPTREYVEKVVCALEKGADALAFPSGMAAVSCLMELFSPGDEILATDDLYGGSIRLFDRVSVKNGLVIRYVDTTDLEQVKNALTGRVRAVFVESPTNPMMKVTDLRAVKELLPDGVLFIVDNTFLTPYLCRPMELGADIVLHSGTKYLGGHNDTLAGFLVAASNEIAERLRFLHKTTGAVLSPFDSWLIARGIKTLSLRIERSQQSAMKIALWLKGHPKVTNVYYPGLPEHPAYDLSKRQASGFGAMLSFRTDTEETAKAILGGTKVILYAESLGGVETLITWPVTQTHADVPLEQRLARGIDGRLLRLSVGIEDPDDLIEDLAAAMAP